MRVYSGEFTKIYDPSVVDEVTGDVWPWYINDHTIIKGPDGWHLFGITHEEPADPLNEKNLAHAIGEKLTQGMWKKLPYALRYSPADNETHLWAPHVILVDGLYYMYYCAGSPFGNDTYRIHLATSPDLYNWTRHPENPMVIDGFDARDPMVFRVGDEWVMYYTCNASPKGGCHCVACVRSKDLIHWDGKRNVFIDPIVGTCAGPCESPFVVKHGEKYLLFIGPRNLYSETGVFVSDDPFHFNIMNQVGTIPSHAAEIVEDDDGKLYITRCGWGEGGVYIAPLYIED